MRNVTSEYDRIKYEVYSSRNLYYQLPFCAMKKNKKDPFNSVTPVSRIVAIILFLVLPFLGFYLGVQYQKSVSQSEFMQYGVLAE